MARAVGGLVELTVGLEFGQKQEESILQENIKVPKWAWK